LIGFLAGQVEHRWNQQDAVSPIWHAQLDKNILRAKQRRVRMPQVERLSSALEAKEQEWTSEKRSLQAALDEAVKAELEVRERARALMEEKDDQIEALRKVRWRSDPIDGCQIGTKCPVLHAK
jgi:hypothetical protein